MADYVGWAHVMRRLLPPGKLFDEMETPPGLREGPVLWRLFKGFGREVARLEQRILLALEEMDPRTATETLDDWERAHGLPDLRIPVLPATVAGRQAALAAKMAARGAQNEAAYSALITACGWTLIELRRINTRPVFRASSRVGDRCYGLAWACTVEFLVGGETVDSLSLANLTSVLQWTMQQHAYALVTYVP